jgi:hypothetical protein
MKSSAVTLGLFTAAKDSQIEWNRQSQFGPTA